jgi:transcriptional regulator with GAF, ATPase, and Fis domain
MSSDPRTTVIPDEDRTSEDRERLLAKTFLRLADTLVDDFDVVDFLHALSADSVSILRVKAAGVMLDDGQGGLRLIASSEEKMRLLELFELQAAEGPCLDAFRTGTTQQADTEEGWRRWPGFAGAAGEAGFRLMCGVPLQLRGRVIGALNLFRDDDTSLNETELVLAKAMAEVAAIGLLHERAISDGRLLAEQLQTALQSRVAIEQAKGMISEYLGISVDDAFQALRKRARNHNMKLTELARQVTSRQLLGDAFTDR